MRFLSRQIVFREIPTEISLSYLVTGCQMKCPGCHSSDAWNAARGETLDFNRLSLDLQRYGHGITCVLFMGGEWHEAELASMLAWIRNRKLKTALFTGLDEVSDALKANLDYLKIGPYVAHLGGLESPDTNQKLIHLPTNQIINIRSNIQEDTHDSAQSQPDTGQNKFRSPIHVGGQCG